MELFPSTLIIGQHQKLLLEKATEILKTLGHQLDHNPDLFIVNDISGYGISKIREIQSFLSLQPYSHQSRVILIENIQNLENEAQNALLKNLEEPGNSHYFILTTTGFSKLIPTIVSRCHPEYVGADSNSNLSSILCASDTKSALALSDASMPKENIRPIFQNELNFFQKQLRETADLKTSSQIALILQCLQFIDHNVDPKSALDYYLLKNL